MAKNARGRSERSRVVTTTTDPLNRSQNKATASPVPAQVNDCVRKWVAECAELAQPDQIIWCDGSNAEADHLFEQGVRDGTFIKLNQQKLPGCYLHRSNPNDVARSEHLTFICTPSQDMAGPSNNWIESKAAYAKLRPLFSGCMRGRTMYVIPFVMG